MTTWQELRQNALTLLDVKPTATTASDIRVAVDARMVQVRDKFYNMRVPPSLIKTSSSITIDAADEYLVIEGSGDGTHPGFNVLDLRKVFALRIQTTTEGRPLTWTFTPYMSWIEFQSAIEGDQRSPATYTIDSNNYIYLRDMPSGSDTWTAYLDYYREPDVITDGGIPELDVAHHELFVLEVVIGFPNLFASEERIALYTSLLARREEQMKLFKGDSPVMAKPRARLRLFPVRKVRSGVFWGNGEAS